MELTFLVRKDGVLTVKNQIMDIPLDGFLLDETNKVFTPIQVKGKTIICLDKHQSHEEY